MATRSLLIGLGVVTLGLGVAVLAHRSPAPKTALFAPPHRAATVVEESPPPRERVAPAPAPAEPEVAATAPSGEERNRDLERMSPEEQDRVGRAQLVASGRADEPWMRGASTILDAFRSGAGSDLTRHVDFGRLDCFRAGCLTTATYDDFNAYQVVNASLPETEEFRAWKGWRHRTGPRVLPSGKVEATWFFMSPEAAD